MSPTSVSHGKAEHKCTSSDEVTFMPSTCNLLISILGVGVTGV